MPPKNNALDRLERRREMIKNQVQKILQYATDADDSTSYDSLLIRLNNLNLLYSEFKDVEGEIFDKNEQGESQQLEFDDTYYDTQSLLNEKLRKCHHQNSPAQPSVNQTLNNSFSLNNAFANSLIFENKIGGISLPKFSGHYDDWQTFIDLFNKAVHENEQISGAQKFTFLKLALKDDAYQLIKHMPVSEANYLEVYDKLCKRYSKKKLILNQFIQQFLEINPPSNSNKIRYICDKSDELIRGIKSLGKDAETRDVFLIHIVLNKLDNETQRKWSNETTNIDFPSWKMFQDFLTKSADSIELCHSSNLKSNQNQHNKKGLIFRSHSTSIITCTLCKNNHKLYECSEFKNMNFTRRKEYVISQKLCYNCLSSTHTIMSCKSKRSCLKCKKRHHTLLHNQTDISHTSSSDDTTKHLNNASSSATEPQPSTSVYTAKTTTNNIVKGLLQTVSVNVSSANQQKHPCRALLDSASMTSFITSSCVQKLGLTRQNSRYFVEGIGSTRVGVTKGQVILEISPRINKMKPILIEALVIPKISSQLPEVAIPCETWHDYRNLELADPMFHQPSGIDILIGAEHYLSLIRPGHLESTNSKLVAQETVFGWVISGQTTLTNQNKIMSHHTVSNVDETLRMFWEIEQIKQPTLKSPNEIYCEELFTKTTYKNNSGKIVVQLPFKDDVPPLGESKSQAVRRLMSVERRTAKNPEFQQQYLEFMEEYLELGHMERIPQDEININNEKCYYLPHHAIIKADSSTTKLRVVFDASAKTTSGRSLNDNLRVGPTIQQSLQQILLRFRSHKFVMTGDIEKMFRQFLVAKCHTDFQRILWRRQPSDDIQEYRLLTITYGTSCASFLSTRVLRKIADDCSNKFPRASKIIADDFYVDDLMTGANTEADLINLKQEITSVMNDAHLNLRKWSSNSKSLMSLIPISDREVSPIRINDHQSYVKVLGIFWNSDKDIFSYKIKLDEKPILTKRGMLSEASRLFDPHGWLAPVVIYVKILFQKLWMCSLDWDDNLPHDVESDWLNFRKEAEIIQRYEIPRWVNFNDNSTELHGFADASKNAYAAVIYARIKNGEEYTTVIVAAKTKVAPIKQISIAKLELCAALLLAKLMDSTLESINVKPKLHLWSDSTIVLCWLSSIPCSLGTFEGNRVSQITESYPRKFWDHVTSTNNPADLASRGVLPSKLLESNLWWTGPTWLRLSESKWPNFQKSSTSSSNSSTTSSLLTPFDQECNSVIYENEILRVGGRISKAAVAYDIKHPIVLPSNEPLVIIIVRTLHEQHLHAGHSLLLNIIREKFWILRCKNVIRQIIFKCTVCHRQKKQTIHPKMADLPACRVNLVRPFITTGVDYAGPLYISQSKRRGTKPVKAYIVVFVCYSTKAIHLELAGDMTTESFIAAFRRFTSRRGLCRDMYSDNGSNFIGAKKELNELFTLLKNNSIFNFLSRLQINWHFQPPASPHFGGMFEAAVKSVKFHLRRALSTTSLNYEEMLTLLVQIEALLNSRPLHTISEDELNPLTPAHFLIGHTLTSLPDPDLSHLKLNHLSRWQYVQRLQQEFWKGWYKSYLTSLQKRTKWQNSTHPPIKMNDIVLIHESNLPPSKWILGRVIELHPGSDGIIRVVTIKTSDTILKRPVVKLSILPIY